MEKSDKKRQFLCRSVSLFIVFQNGNPQNFFIENVSLGELFISVDTNKANKLDRLRILTGRDRLFSYCRWNQGVELQIINEKQIQLMDKVGLNLGTVNFNFAP